MIRVKFFFFKQKTAYEIYQCDWSSDVCSSDLFKDLKFTNLLEKEWKSDSDYDEIGEGDGEKKPKQIGRASCRERV